MSKMSVIEETNATLQLNYQMLVFVEFLEFLARIAELNFVDSEMEELELN